MSVCDLVISTSTSLGRPVWGWSSKLSLFLHLAIKQWLTPWTCSACWYVHRVACVQVLASQWLTHEVWVLSWVEWGGECMLTKEEEMEWVVYLCVVCCIEHDKFLCRFGWGCRMEFSCDCVDNQYKNMNPFLDSSIQHTFSSIFHQTTQNHNHHNIPHTIYILELYTTLHIEVVRSIKHTLGYQRVHHNDHKTQWDATKQFWFNRS